jgi:hypothetical protein
MRSVEILLITGLIALVGVAGWQGRHWFPRQTLASAPSVIAPAQLTPSPKAGSRGAQTAGIHSDKRGARSGAGGLLAAEQPTTGEPVNATVKIVQAPPSDPDSLKLPSGTSRSEVRERLGTPSVDVQSTREGGLLERYYYLSSDRANLTVATLHNGKLVGMQTVPR